MSHTPTPWHVRTLDESIGGFDCANGQQIGQVFQRTPPKTKADLVERQANAEFIVRACNSHDALVAALRFIKLMTADRLTASDCALHDRAVAAIAAAGAA